MNEDASLHLHHPFLAVQGILNFKTVPELWKQSLPMLAMQNEIRMDLANVTSANSAALALLLEWLKYAKRVKKTIQFEHIPAQLLSIIKVAGVDNIIG